MWSKSGDRPSKEIFGCEHANVQPHAGAQANMAVLMTALEHGDQILGMNLSHGGHLTHGHPLNFSGINYKVADYGVNKDTEQIDYDELQKIAEESRPKMLICGASAYPRTIDFATHRRDRTQRRCEGDGRYRAHCGIGRDRFASFTGSALRIRDDDYA